MGHWCPLLQREPCLKLVTNWWTSSSLSTVWKFGDPPKWHWFSTHCSVPWFASLSLGPQVNTCICPWAVSNICESMTEAASVQLWGSTALEMSGFLRWVRPVAYYTLPPNTLVFIHYLYLYVYRHTHQVGDYTLLPPRILAEPRNIQFRQWGPWTFLFLLLLWFLLPIIWILSESPVILSSHDISLSLLYPFSTQFQTTNPRNENTSTKSFGLDSQGRGFRTEFTKTWRWIIRHGHQTHHVRPKGNENPPIEKHHTCVAVVTVAPHPWCVCNSKQSSRFLLTLCNALLHNNDGKFQQCKHNFDLQVPGWDLSFYLHLSSLS